MSESSDRKPLKLVTCGGCNAKTFLPQDLAPFETTPCNKCGHPLIIPFLLRHFELRSVVASGGMGTVYRAFDTVLLRVVAIKLLKREIAEDPQMLEGFYKEARACASLNHTNIIHIYNFDEWDGQQFLVMELADNGSLDSRIDQQRILPELEVLDVGIKIASALDTALKHGLLHRDIKPGNILYNSEGEPKLVDFGLAKKADEDEVVEDGIFGTPFYVAPERIRRQQDGFLADMYSLGATLYHAITGQVPFDAPTPEEVVMMHVQNPLTPPSELNPDITSPTNEAIVATLAKEPAHRYQSYDELIMALTAARSQLLVQRYIQSAEE